MSNLSDMPLTGRVHTGAHAHTKLNVLIACEESQAECAAFRNLGHTAYSCDIEPCRKGGRPDWHIQGDCTPLLLGATQFTCQDGILRSVPAWDLIIAHPPCTFITRAGAVRLFKKTANGRIINNERYVQMKQAVDFFNICLGAHAPFVAVENPIPMRCAGLPKPSFYVCPSWFGVRYTKKTLYWVRNLPPIMAEIDFPNPTCFVKSARGKYRSRTFPQMANAIARQWSSYIIEHYPQSTTL